MILGTGKFHLETLVFMTQQKSSSVVIWNFTWRKLFLYLFIILPSFLYIFIGKHFYKFFECFEQFHIKGTNLLDIFIILLSFLYIFICKNFSKYLLNVHKSCNCNIINTKYIKSPSAIRLYYCDIYLMGVQKHERFFSFLTR